ncbi:hypothetical protein BDN71DRAFT_1448329 [Pleurotus eryngii]|uniref:Uncharacterized protein n=1 Tax=Pleurotus eryngii TaxID=5323 RepID=A0A9P5ZUY8_PLEER|nr:hypothetical protein BDN71DRAFT_1448329 [Pleurotus eryngii]
MSSSASTITTWAAHVQPGSPSSPSHQTTTQRTRKHRRPSISRLHLNLAPSLPSLPRHARARSGSASFLHILDTPSTGSRVSPTRNNVNVNVMNNTPVTPKSSPHTADADAFDLTALGYTSLFLHLPTPATPHYPTPTLPYNLPSDTYSTTTHISNPINNSNGNATAHDNMDHNANTRDTKDTTDKTFKSAFARLRSRSFSALLRPRKPSSSSTPPSPRALAPGNSATNAMDVPPVPTIPPQFRSQVKNAKNAAKDVKTKDVKESEDTKKVKKAKKEKKHALPPTLASELALLQFLDGGSLEDNIAALNNSSLSTTASTSVENTTTNSKGNRNGVGCGGEWVYTDACGRVWRDADEALEYVHLLAPSPTSSTSSVSPTPYSPAFSIVSISFPSSPLSGGSFPASSPSSPLTGGVFPSTPTRMDAKWITFTAYSPSSPSFPSPSSSNTSSLHANFTKRRRSSLVKRDSSMHKTTMRKESMRRTLGRRGSLVRKMPRTPPCTSLPPTPYSPYSTTPYSTSTSDVEMSWESGDERREKRMGMAGLGFWAI